MSWQFLCFSSSRAQSFSGKSLMPSNSNFLVCVCVCAGITPRTYCLPQISWKIFWFGHQNIPHVAVHNQTNVALFFAFAQSLIYEHGIKSTDFPQACGTCSVYFCELCGSGLDDWLSNSNSCLSDNPHMQCVVNCYKLQIVIGLHCFVSWSWTWPALWPVKLTNTTAGPAVREKAGSESVVNVDLGMLWTVQCGQFRLNKFVRFVRGDHFVCLQEHSTVYILMFCSYWWEWL